MHDQGHQTIAGAQGDAMTKDCCCDSKNGPVFSFGALAPQTRLGHRDDKQAQGVST